jgi:5-methylcytosine-specific restriction endonuclease McrA
VKYRIRTEYHRQWRRKHAEKVNTRASPAFKRWRDENREHRLAWEAQYRASEPYRTKNRTNQIRRRALKAGASGDHTAEEFAEVLRKQNFRCFYCSAEIADCATEDHFIPLSKGGANDISNIRAACLACNIRKHNRMPIVMEASS